MRSLGRDHAQRFVDGAQHAVELMPAAHDQPGGGDHAIDALASREPGILLDAVDRHLRGAPEYRKDRAVLEKIDRVVAPFAGGDHAAIEIEDAVEFFATEGHLIEGGDGGCGSTQY